jgi:hypothetical protein
VEITGVEALLATARPLQRPAIHLAELWFLRSMRRQCEIARVPAYRTYPASMPDETVGMIDSDRGPVLLFMALMAGELGKRDGCDQAQADARGTALFLALLAYHHRHGSYPDRLDQLATVLPDLNLGDPLSGQPFRYHRQGDGFVLYSVGTNFRDDGRRPAGQLKALYAGEDGSDWDGDGDLVWQMPVPPLPPPKPACADCPPEPPPPDPE